jgi:hypothetical protein
MKAGKKKPLDWPSGAVGFVFTCGWRRKKKNTSNRGGREYSLQILYDALIGWTIHNACNAILKILVESDNQL